MTGYVRNDTSNNIADGNVIDAADLDGEFDAIESAFVAATGHTHDGTTSEGGAITVTGPAQDYISGASNFTPKTDSVYDLGTTGVRWSTGYLDNLVLTTALPVTQGGTGSTTGSAARTSLGVAIGSDVQAYSAVLDGTTASYTTAEETKLAGIEALADVTDTTNVTAAGALMDSEVDADIKTLSLPANTTISAYGATLVDDVNAATARTTLGLGTLSTQNSGTVSITGGSIAGITDLAIADGGTGASTAAGALTNFGLTATASELNTLDGITATTTELNYTDGVTSAIQTQLNTLDAADNPLTQVEVEDDTSTVFGQVSGERLAQAVAAHESSPPDTYELLSRTVTSGSPTVVDFTFNPALYDAIVFAFSNVSPATDGAQFLFQTSADGGATFHTNYNYTRWRGGTSTTYATRSGTSASACEVSLQNGSAANEFLSGYLSVFNAAHAAFTQIVSDVVYENIVGALFSDRGTAISQTSAVVNAARFSWSSGNFDNDCVITMYGVRNS